MRQHLLLFPVVLGGFSTPTIAQDAGSLLRDRERGTEAKLPEPKLDVESVRPEFALPDKSTPGEVLLIKKVQFSGKTSLLDDATRARLTSGLEGKEVGFAAIRALAEAINTELRQDGHLLARATIPPQDATSGTLTIDISEGAVDDIALEYAKGTRIKRSIVSGIVKRHVDFQSLTQNDLESAMLRVNDLPGVAARSRLAPGQAAGTSRLIVDVSEEPIFSASLNGDNFGSPSTGRIQGHAQVVLSDAAGLGELTRLGFSYSEGQRYASAALALPISASGLSTSLSYAFLDYKNVDAIGLAAGLRGRAHYGTLALHYQAVRSRDVSLRFSASVNGKALIDDSAAGRLQNKRIVTGSLGFNADLNDKALGGGVTQISASWTYGKLDLARVPSALLNDGFGLQTQGRFHRLNADVLRLQKLPGAFSLLVRASGQWASKNLDSSESFSLGGPYGVRGWPVGEGRGDAGLTGTAELRYNVPLKPPLGAFQLSVFTDHGRVWLNKQTFGLPALNACGCNSYTLSSAGAGLTWRNRNLSLSGSWARGLGSNPGRSAFGGTNVDGRSDRQQFWLSGSLSF